MNQENNNIKNDSKRPPSVAIDPIIYSKLSARAKERKITLVWYVEEILQATLKKKELLKQLFPKLRLIAADKNSVYIKDDAMNDVAEIR